MNKIIIIAFFTINMLSAQNVVKTINLMYEPEILKTKSHLNDLNIAISHYQPNVVSNDYPILLLHGSSFPSALSFGFEMNNTSWTQNLNENGYDVYTLDFLGYGNSDRYPQMKMGNLQQATVGKAVDVCKDVAIAADEILKRTGKEKVYLIGHSWGGTVAALFASKYPDKVVKLILLSTITLRNETSKPEKINGAYDEMTPEQRIDAMKNLTPKGQICQLEKEIFKNWGEQWKKSDPLVKILNNENVRFPSGPNQDIEDLLHNKSYYDPSKIKAPTLVIRGEWVNILTTRMLKVFFQI